MIFKASRITNLTDARYFAAKDVHFLGFNLEEGTPGYLDPVHMKAIREWVQGPQIVGEFDRTPAATVLEAAAFYGLDAVQVAQTEGLPLLAPLRPILSLPATADVPALQRLFEQQRPYVACFLLDFSENAGATASLFETPAPWRQLFARYPVFLDFDAPADVLPALLHTLQPAGLALRGGEEEQVGVKSFEAIEAVFEALGLA